MKPARASRLLVCLVLSACAGDAPPPASETKEALKIWWGGISASPRVVVAAPGTLGRTIISWRPQLGLPAPDPAVVTVSVDGAAPTLFASGPSGSSPAPWIQAGHRYRFSYGGGFVDVLGVPRGGGAIFATPAQLTTTAPALATSVIDWASDGIAGEVSVSVNGGPAQSFSGAPEGPQSAPWIQAGHFYDFSYRAVADRRELARATVVGLAPGGGAIIASPAALRQAGPSSSTIRWFAPGPAAEVWVSKNGAPETRFAVGKTGSADAVFITGGDGFDFRLYDGAAHARLLGSVHVAARAPYSLGVHYHSTGSDLTSSLFLTHYDDPAVRATVRAQLQGMADAGAEVIKTTVWLGLTGPGDDWLLHFPPTPVELANLSDYARDIAAVQARDGHRLSMEVVMTYIWASDFTVGSPATTLGEMHLPADAFLAATRASGHTIVDAVAGIRRPDGRAVADLVAFNAELAIDEHDPSAGTHNEAWLLDNLYPDFVAYAQARGVTPSLSFFIDNIRSEILDDAFVDSNYPALNGHRSSYWIYKSISFLQHHNLPVPARLDMSCYVDTDLIGRVFADLDAVLPSLGVAPRYGIAETFYYSNEPSRRALGAALAGVGPRLESVRFWTTPNGGGPGVDAAYPFVFSDFVGP